MLQDIDIEEYFNLSSDWSLLDVRSPGEFLKAHIPGAYSLPLFSDEERAEVGTLYKQVDPDTAFLKGLEFAGAKMRDYVEKARTISSSNKIIVQCWRGGQRSASMAWLLSKAGFQVKRLVGGYKAFRKYAHDYFASDQYQLICLGGASGSGKTVVLQTLKQQSQPVLDLEALAHHKGSAFGALGEELQPSNEQFENNLFFALYQLPRDKAIWVEYESKGIGKVYLPDPFYHKMCKSPLVQLEVSQDQRVAHLVEIYGQFEQQDLTASFEKIRKRLGGLHYQQAVAAVEENNLGEAARIALAYYDKTYYYGLGNKHEGEQETLVVDQFDANAIALGLIEKAETMKRAIDY